MLLVSCSFPSHCDDFDFACSLPLGVFAFAPISRGRGVHTANGAAASFSSFRIDYRSPSFLPAASGTQNLAGSTRGIAVDSGRSLLYVTEIVTPSLNVYSLNRETASAEFLRSQSIATPGNHLAIDPGGRFLFALTTTQVQAYVLDGAGSAAPVGGLVGTMTSAQAGILDPAGRYLYVTDTAAAFQRFTIGPDGIPGASVATSCGAQARGLLLARGGSVVHCFDPTTSAVYHYRLQADGSLQSAGSHSPGVTGFRGGAYNSTETILYVLDSTANVIRPYLVNLDAASIQMTAVGTPASVPATADQIFADGSGRFLIVTSTANVSLYAIERNPFSPVQVNSHAVPNLNDAVVYNQYLF